MAFALSHDSRTRSSPSLRDGGVAPIYSNAPAPMPAR